MPRPTALRHMHTKSAFGHIVDVGRQDDHPILCVVLDRQAIQQRGLAVRVHHLPMRHRRVRNLSPTVFMNAAAPFVNSPLQGPSCIRWLTRDDGVRISTAGHDWDETRRQQEQNLEGQPTPLSLDWRSRRNRGSNIA